MRDSGKFYHHSGAVGALFVPRGIVLDGTAIVLLGIAYAYVIRYCPFIYLNVIALCGFAGGVGWAISDAVRNGKCRNRVIHVLAGMAAILLALYTTWVAWLLIFSGHQYLILDPRHIWRLLPPIAARGVWSIGSSGTPVTGILLYIARAAEAVGLAVVTVFFARLTAPGAFCERCGKWGRRLRDSDRLAFASGTDRKAFVKSLAMGDMEAVLGLKPCAQDCLDWLTVEIDSCPSCKDLLLLSVSRHVMTPNRAGEPQIKSTVVMRNRLIDLPTCTRLVEEWSTATGEATAATAG